MTRFLLTLVSVCFISNTHFAQNYKYGKISKEELEATSHSLDSEANAAVLYRKASTKFVYDEEDGFMVRTEFQERIKIYNKDGYKYATQEIGLYKSGNAVEQANNLKAVTYNLVDGSIKESKLQSKGIFDEERSKSLKVKKFTMPDIQDGCIIEYKYSFVSPFISRIDEFRFQEEIPVDKVDMQFFAPEYLVYRTHGKGSLPLNIKNEKKGRTIRFKYQSGGVSRPDGGRNASELDLIENGYIVNLENVPAIKEEPFTGNLNNYMSALQFELSYTKFPNAPLRTYTTSWEDVAKKIYKSEAFGEELELTKYYRDDIEALLSGVSDPKEKIAKIYAFIKTKMSWNEYYGVYVDKGVKKAYKEGVGNIADINLMFISMLNYAGIEASPVLISTKSNGIPFFPTRSGFNYVVAGVKINGGLFLLDGADKYGTIGILKTNLLNWKGRMVKKDGSSRLVDLYPPKPAVHNSFMNIEISDDLTITGNSKNRFSGHYARNQRGVFGDLSEDEQVEKMEERYASIETIDHSFKDMKDIHKPLSLEYNFEDEAHIEEIGDKIYITPLFHLATEKNYFTAEDRAYPVDFTYPWTDKYNVSIKIPEGYKVESLPESLNVNLSEGMGSYRYGVSEAMGKISIAVQNAIKTPVIGAEYYKDLQQYYKMIVEKENEKIVLVKS